MSRRPETNTFFLALEIAQETIEELDAGIQDAAKRTAQYFVVAQLSMGQK